MHSNPYFVSALSKMQHPFKSIKIDKGTAWDQKYETSSSLTSDLPPSVDLRNKFADAKIEIYDQVRFNSPPLPPNQSLRRPYCHNREDSVRAQPMQSAQRGDMHKPSSTLGFRHPVFSCTITNGVLKEPHPKIPGRILAMDADLSSLTAFALSIRGLTLRQRNPYNPPQRHTTKEECMSFTHPPKSPTTISTI